jgi:hypothetical protein
MLTAKKSGERGFAVLFVVLAAILALIVGGILYFVKHHSSVNSAQSTQSNKPSSFAECANKGGGIAGIEGEINIPQAVDSKADSLMCIYDAKRNIFFYANNDARCRSQLACAEINLAAKIICFPPYNPDTNSRDPTFMYLPVIKDDYAVLQLSDCTSAHSRKTILATVIMKNSNSNWAIFKQVAPSSLCQTLDGQGIPPELDITCLESTGKIRSART